MKLRCLTCIIVDTLHMNLWHTTLEICRLSTQCVAYSNDVSLSRFGECDDVGTPWFLGCWVWFCVLSVYIWDARLMSGCKYMCELENLQRWLISTNNIEMPLRFWLGMNFPIYTKSSLTQWLWVLVLWSRNLPLRAPCFRGAKMTDALTLPRVFPPSCAHIHGRPNLPHSKEIEGEIHRHRKIRSRSDQATQVWQRLGSPVGCHSGFCLLCIRRSQWNRFR